MNTPERVADYPRPPRLEPVALSVRVMFAGREIARSDRALRILETYHPPSYYLPPDAFVAGVLQPEAGSSFCEWKGHARYWSVRANGQMAQRCGWSYPQPTAAYAALSDHVALYAGAMEACFVGDEQVRPQPGGFYGGWITANLIGPFKGGPGTEFW